MAVLRHLLLALQYFTRIPVTGALGRWAGWAPQDLRAATAHLPAVGWVVGGVTAVLAWCLLSWLPEAPAAAWVAAVLSTAAGAWLTGALHEDGLADVADGLGGSLERSRALEIMKDPRLGSFGALALVLAVLAKVALLALLAARGPLVLAAALFAGHVASRGYPLLLIRLLPYVGDPAHSKSAPMASRIGGWALLVGLLWTASGVLLAAHWLPVMAWVHAMALATLAWAWLAWRFQRRLRGFTGDCLGATQQVCELAFLLGLAGAP